MHEVVGRSWMMLQGLDLVECICKRRKSDFPFIRIKKKRLFQDLTIFFYFFTVSTLFCDDRAQYLP